MFELLSQPERRADKWAGLPSSLLSASATPTQRSFTPQPPAGPAKSSLERDGLHVPAPSAANAGAGASARNLSASAVTFAPRGSSLNPSPALGSFVSELRSQTAMLPLRAASRLDGSLDKLDVSATNNASASAGGDDDDDLAVRALSALRDRLNREMKIKEGSENMLEALNAKKAKQTREQRLKVEAELNASNQRIRDLRQKINDAARRPRAAAPATPTRARTDVVFQTSNGLRSPPSASRSGAGSDLDEPAESPTFVLAEILQALEADGLPPEYYVARANSLVELFKRHPNLKYDLVWSVFGVRMQVMLLSESREVVAAGYRMTRYAISDVSSLKKIRTLNTDYLVVMSLIKDRKADVEREQALKFVRTFLDVKDGVRELSRAIVRTIAAIAEHSEDRLRPICIQTLAEILVRDPPLLIASGGLAPLSEALAEGSYKAPESLAAVILFLLDAPHRRTFLRAGYELEVLFTAFTDQYLANEVILKQNSKAIESAMKTWSGLMSLSMYNFRAIRSLVASLMLPNNTIRLTIIDLLYSLLRIKSPAWATSFLAGRRLTTYGRVASLKTPATAAKDGGTPYVEDDGGEQNFVEHYTALLLAILVRAGLLPTLLRIAQDADNAGLKRKSTLLIGEVLRLSSRLLPPSWSSQLQLLPELFTAATRFQEQDHFVATGIVYQISSVSRTLYRSSPSTWTPGVFPSVTAAAAGTIDLSLFDDQPKASTSMSFDDATFRQLLLESGILSSSNYSKWKWDVVLKVIEGPLTNGKRLEEAIKASKFIKRLASFYRPFKYKFSEIGNTRSTQKYVRVGCALMHTLLQTAEGVRYLGDNKLLRQIAECLAQCDPTSGITAQDPMFAKDRLTDTLCGGYFTMLGVLSSDVRGLQMMDRWRMFNMMYHIVDLKQRPDLIKLLLSSFDYTLNGHPRVLLSKALTASIKDIRIHATNVLRKYAVRSGSGSPFGHGVGDSKWAIRLLVTQLYDPEVDVCATAVKILEKACNDKSSLEFIVECRPALDHLGEIGAPLLLRFLSTSIGYHYLDGLDYISNEMDDWFLGRNDSYVNLIEASLKRAFDYPDDQTSRISVFEDGDADTDAHIPPHFYRELTRTHEGCKLLSDKGHFDEFATTIRDHGMQYEDSELVTKVKGCMWAVGNVGSMELGGPFLESCDAVEQIVKIAQGHEVMSLRGTAFFVLGLISRSTHGLEILSEYGWDSNTNSLGTSLGFCIPTDLSQFFSLAPWKHETVTSIQLPPSQKTETTEPPILPSRPRSASFLSSTAGSEAGEARVQLDPDPTNQRILELVIDLGNMVIFKRAAQELIQVKQQKKSPGFRQPRMLRRVMALLECHHYRLPIRRMVLELFDKAVLRHIVFDEDGDGPGNDEDDDDDDDDANDNDDDDSDDSDNDNDEAERSGDDVGKAATDDEAGNEAESSGDEQRTERQRSISDPADLEKATAKKRRR